MSQLHTVKTVTPQLMFLRYECITPLRLLFRYDCYYELTTVTTSKVFPDLSALHKNCVVQIILYEMPPYYCYKSKKWLR